MIENIGKDYIKLTGEKFARIVAYALGLGAIFWFLGELLGFFNELQTAVRGADVRAALQKLLFTVAFSAAALFVASWYIRRVGRKTRLREVLAIKEAGEEVIARQKEVRDLLEMVSEKSDRAQEYMERAERALKAAGEAESE